MNPFDPVITKGGDAGRLESEVEEIVFNPEVSDLEYFLSRKRYFERRKASRPEAADSVIGGNEQV